MFWFCLICNVQIVHTNGNRNYYNFVLDVSIQWIVQLKAIQLAHKTSYFNIDKCAPKFQKKNGHIKWPASPMKFVLIEQNRLTNLCLAILK